MSGAAEEGGFGRLRHPVLLVLLYTLAGPPLAAIAVFAAMALAGFATGQPLAPGHLLASLPLSYLVGGVPAFASGLLVVGLSSQTGAAATYPAVTAIGAGTGFALPFLQQVISGPPAGDAPPLALFALFGLAGAAAAAIVRRLGHRLHETPP